MPFYEHLSTFANKTVIDWEPGKKFDPATQAPRLTLGYDAEDTWPDLFTEFLQSANAERTTALVVGAWFGDDHENSSAPVVEALVANRAKLPLLEALFFGDVLVEECEISWLNQSDVAPLFHAFPRLREFAVRGGNSLNVGTIRHPLLQKLVIQTGGLDESVVKHVLASNLPQLSHLELWLGDDGYGTNTSADDFKPLFAGNLFPNLKYLGLVNAQIADDLAAALTGAPILNRIETLDLSNGTLGDEGAQALINNPAIANLKHLDIHHHYCTDEVLAQLKSKVKSLNAEEQEDPGADNEDRYVSVGE